MEPHPTRDEIIAEIIRIQEEIGVSPGRSEFEKHSEFSRDDILRHFEWYSEAIKTVRSATSTTTEASDAAESRATESTSDSSSPDDGSRVDSPEEKQVEQEDEGSREDEVGEEHTANEAGASDQPNSKTSISWIKTKLDVYTTFIKARILIVSVFNKPHGGGYGPVQRHS
jgi:hypothetical protein